MLGFYTGCSVNILPFAGYSRPTISGAAVVPLFFQQSLDEMPVYFLCEMNVLCVAWHWVVFKLTLKEMHPSYLQFQVGKWI